MNAVTTQKLLKDLDSDNPTLQAEALMLLSEAEVYEASLKIIEILNSSEPAIRANAAYALGNLGIQQIDTVGAALLDALNDPEELVRAEAIEALGDLDYTPAAELIAKLLRNDPSALVRASAAEILGELGNSQAIKTLESALLDPHEDESVRAYAANAIGFLATSEFVPKLETYIHRESSLGVKAELLGAAYWLGKKEAIAELLNLLANADESLALHILNILTDLSDRANPPTLGQDAPSMSTELEAIAQRFPILRSQAEQILAANNLLR